jgi:F0F1-type ATP synthase assembly protein I
MTFQMMATIAIMCYIGYWIDKSLTLKFPAFMLIFCLMGVFAALYQIIKSLPKE